MAEGDLISDYCRSIPGYERIECEPAFNLALYYHADHRHALFVRNGVVFRMAAQIKEDEARFSFDCVRQMFSTRPGHPNPVLDYYQRVYPVENDARTAALSNHGRALFNALQSIVNASHDQVGSMVEVRPKRVAEAIRQSLSALGEASEDARDAERAVKAVMRRKAQEAAP